MITFINPYEFNIRGTYQEPTDSGDTEEDVTWAQKTGDQYASMALKRLPPRRGSETYEANQLVAEQRVDFLVKKSNRSFSKNGRLLIGTNKYYIEGVRHWKSFSNYLVLDTVIKDNQA